MITEASPYDIGRIGLLGRSFVENSVFNGLLGYDEEGFTNALFDMVKIGIFKIFVKKTDHTLVGAIGLLLSPNIYSPNERMARIFFLDVLPTHQKKGIANELISEAHKWCVENGISSLSIEVEGESLKGKMCDRYGFRDIGYSLLKRIGD